MRPWRGGCFSHLRYARHVSIASIICMATAPVFGPSFESFSLRAILFFFQSVSQSTTIAITTIQKSLRKSVKQSINYYYNHYCNRYIPEISPSTNQLINQSRPPTTITYQGLLPADLWLEIDVFLDLLSANISLKSHRIARPVTNTLLGLLPAYLSLEINVFLGLFASSSRWGLSLQIDAFLGLWPVHLSLEINTINTSN